MLGGKNQLRKTFALIAHQTLLKELVFDDLDIEDVDLKDFANLWLLSNNLKILRIKKCQKIKGEFYMKDFLDHISKDLNLDLLDLSRNQLNSSISDSLIETIFTSKSCSLKALDLSFNRLNELENSILHEIFRRSRAFGQLKLVLEPFFQGLIKSMGSQEKVDKEEDDKEVENLMNLFRQQGLKEEAPGELFDSIKISGLSRRANTMNEKYSINEEENYALDSAAKPFQSFRAEESEPEIKVFENDQVFDKDNQSNSLKEMLASIEDLSASGIGKLLEKTAFLKNKGNSLIQEIGPSGYQSLKDFCIGQSKIAFDHENIIAWNQLQELANNTGMLQDLLASNEDYRRQSLICQSKMFAFKSDVAAFLAFTGKAAELNDQLDSLCERIVTYGVGGEGADLILLMREKRNWILEQFAKTEVEDTDVQLETMQNNPFMFVSINHDHRAATRDHNDYKEHDFAGVHENWLHYEKLANYTRKELIDIFEEETHDETMGCKKGYDKVKFYKHRRIMFILCQPEGILFSNYKLDKLLVQARTLCRLRWHQGFKTASNLKSVEELGPKYLAMILARNTKVEMINIHNFDLFIEENVRQRTSILSEECQWLKEMSIETEILIKEILSSKVCEKIISEGLKDKIIKWMLDDNICQILQNKEPHTHPFFVKQTLPKPFISTLLPKIFNPTSEEPDKHKLLSSLLLLAAGLSESLEDSKVSFCLGRNSSHALFILRS